MSTVSGVFEGIIAKPGIGKKPPHKPYTLYSVQVAGKKYSYGFDAPKAATGDMVTFETTQNGEYENADPATFKVVAKATAASAATAQASSPAATQSTTNSSIENQVALKAAVEVAIAGGNPTGVDVAKLFAQFQGLLQPKAPVAKAAPPKPKAVEPEDENQDEMSDLPY